MFLVGSSLKPSFHWWRRAGDRIWCGAENVPFRPSSLRIRTLGRSVLQDRVSGEGLILLRDNRVPGAAQAVAEQVVRLKVREGSGARAIRAAQNPSLLSVVQHGSYRVDGDEHPFRMILKAPETQAPAKLRAAGEDFRTAVVDDIQNDQLQPDLAGDIQRPPQRVDRKIRSQTLALPALVHRNHREVKRRNAPGPGRPPGTIRSEFLGRHGVGIQRIVAENFRRPVGYRH